MCYFRTYIEHGLLANRGLGKTMDRKKVLSRENAIVMVLAILRDGVRYGYDIAREVERRSSQTLTFKHGTLYLLLHELEKDNWIVSNWEHPDGERPRRVYGLTDKGVAECEERLRTWTVYTEAMMRVVAGGKALADDNGL